MTCGDPSPDLSAFGRIVVGALISDPAGRILLLKRAPHEFMPGAWEIPSGGVEPGEDLVSALRREIAEETGLALVSVLAQVGHAEYRAGGLRCIQLNFTVECRGLVTLSEEHCDHLWWEPDHADERLDAFMRTVLSPIMPPPAGAGGARAALRGRA